MPRKSPTLQFDTRVIDPKRGFQEAFEDVIEDRQKPSKVRLLASAQGDEDGCSLLEPTQVIESDLEDVRSPLVRNEEHHNTTLSHTFTEPCNCTETRLRLIPREQSSKRIIILACYTMENGQPVRGEIHFNADNAIAEAPGMKTILAEDRQKKEEALTVLIALMTDRRTHDDKAIVYLLSQDIVSFAVYGGGHRRQY